MPKVYCTSFHAKQLGVIYLASTDVGVCKICVPNETKQEFFRWLKRHFQDEDVSENRSKNRRVLDELVRYINGKLTRFTCPTDFIGTPFQKKVWGVVMQIPYGETITYKQLARRAGVPQGYQAVGQANARNPLPVVIPCHRVIGSNGSLTGYSGGVKTKEFLLRLEGVILL
jgi:methylated-DNA-[protein]-cysteine S-methyltransferase